MIWSDEKCCCCCCFQGKPVFGSQEKEDEKKQQQHEKFVQIEILRSHATQKQHEFYAQNTFYGNTLLRSLSRATGFCGWHLHLLFWWCENMNESKFELHHNNQPEGNLYGFCFRILTFHVQRRRFYLAVIFMEEFEFKFLDFFQTSWILFSCLDFSCDKNSNSIGFWLKLFEWKFRKTKKIKNWLNSGKYSKTCSFIRKLKKKQKITFPLVLISRNNSGEKNAKRIKWSKSFNKRNKSKNRAQQKSPSKKFQLPKKQKLIAQNTYFSIDKSLNDDHLSSSMHFLNFTGQWMSIICFEPN